MNGWIKLHRKIRRNPVFNDMQLFRLWVICLTEATHKGYEQMVGKQIVKLEPGQFVTGRYDLHSMYNQGLKKDEQVSEKTVWRWLENLQKHDFLTINSTNKYSIVSINKWDFYQSNDQENDHQMTNIRPSNDQQVTTNKKVKNVKNVKNDKEVINKKEYADFVTLTPDEYQNLIDKLGETKTTDYIEALNLWKGSKGKKTKSDYLTILNWNRRDEKEGRSNEKNRRSTRIIPEDEFDHLSF